MVKYKLLMGDFRQIGIDVNELAKNNWVIRAAYVEKGQHWVWMVRDVD